MICPKNELATVLLIPNGERQTLKTIEIKITELLLRNERPGNQGTAMNTWPCIKALLKPGN